MRSQTETTKNRSPLTLASSSRRYLILFETRNPIFEKGSFCSLFLEQMPAFQLSDFSFRFCNGRRKRIRILENSLGVILEAFQRRHKASIILLYRSKHGI